MENIAINPIKTEDLKTPPPTTVDTEGKKRYYLFMLYSGSGSICEDNVFEIINQISNIKEKRENVEIILVIDSRGGDPYSACKIVHLIRAKCSSLIAVIPFRAKSAATLMTFGSDKIVMGLQSELGPLDMPYQHPLLAGKTISACDVINSLDHIYSTSKKLAIYEYYRAIKEKIFTEMSKKDILKLSINWSIELVKPLISKEDPRVIYECIRILNIAAIYGQELLEKYMLSSLEQGEKKEKIDKIVNNFIWDYPDHSFAIFRDLAKKAGLEIEYSEEFEDWDKIWYTYVGMMPAKEDIISLISQDEFNDAITKKDK